MKPEHKKKKVKKQGGVGQSVESGERDGGWWDWRVFPAWEKGKIKHAANWTRHHW